MTGCAIIVIGAKIGSFAFFKQLETYNIQILCLNYIMVCLTPIKTHG